MPVRCINPGGLPAVMRHLCGGVPAVDLSLVQHTDRRLDLDLTPCLPLGEWSCWLMSGELCVNHDQDINMRNGCASICSVHLKFSCSHKSASYKIWFHSSFLLEWKCTTQSHSLCAKLYPIPSSSQNCSRVCQSIAACTHYQILQDGTCRLLSNIWEQDSNPSPDPKEGVMITCVKFSSLNGALGLLEESLSASKI